MYHCLYHHHRPMVIKMILVQNKNCGQVCGVVSFVTVWLKVRRQDHISSHLSSALIPVSSISLWPSSSSHLLIIVAMIIINQIIISPRIVASSLLSFIASRLSPSNFQQARGFQHKFYFFPVHRWASINMAVDGLLIYSLHIAPQILLLEEASCTFPFPYYHLISSLHFHFPRQYFPLVKSYKWPNWSKLNFMGKCGYKCNAAA